MAKTCLRTFTLLGLLALRAQAQERTPATAPPATRPNPGGPATVVAPAPDAQDGLEVMADLHTPLPRRASRFATLQDATLWLRFKNVSKEAELVAVDEAGRNFRAAALLLDLEITRDDGGPLELPSIHTGSSFDPLGGTGELLFLVPVRWLAPAASFDWAVPFVDLPGWQSIELEPGTYRLRVVYHGPPDLAGLPYPDEGAVRAWRGRAVSQTLRFEITEGEPPLEFGPPQSGLRLAPRHDLFVARWRTDENVPMQFVVENVTDAPLQITRALGGSQDDDSSIQGSDGNERIRGHSTGFGWDPIVTLTLPPHGRARLYAWPLSIGADGIRASGWSEAGAPPDRYVVRHQLRITVGDPSPVNKVIPSGDSFDVPPRTIDIIAAR